MSKMVQIRNVPDDVHARLRERAHSSGMSLSEFLLREITLVSRRATLDEVFARAQARPARLTFDEVVDAIRESRAEREGEWSS